MSGARAISKSILRGEWEKGMRGGSLVLLGAGAADPANDKAWRRPDGPLAPPAAG